MKILLRTMFVLLFPLLSFQTQAQATPAITEWQVPWPDTRPRDPYVDASGKVWFCGQAGNYIAWLNPADGKFKRFDLRTGTHPHNLVIGDDGFVWYAGNRNAHIGRLDPRDGSIKEYPMPDPAAYDPHTLVLDSKGDIWFTIQGGNYIGKLTVKSGVVDLYPVPTRSARPYGIKVDAMDQPWAVLFSSNKMAIIDLPAKRLREINLPRKNSRPRRIEITADGMVWYVDYRGGLLGRYSPTSGEFKEWPLPGGTGARPYGTASDHKGRIWIAESGLRPNRLVGFDPATERFFAEHAVPSGGGTIRHMYFHASAQEVWFGTDTNFIGRLRVD